MNVIDDDKVSTVVASGEVSPRRVPGEPGVWILLFGDMLVFAVFFSLFMYQRAQDPELFDTSRHTLNMAIGLANTFVLLTSSLLVVTAVRAVRAGARSAARAMFAGALVCGLAFVGLKVVEYTAKISEGHVPTENNFYMYYYVLTGFHLLHVLIGIVVLGSLIVAARIAQPSRTRMAFIEGGGCFWHLVDLLWIVLFPLLYLVS